MEVKITKKGEFCSLCMKKPSYDVLLISDNGFQSLTIPMCRDCMKELALAIVDELRNPEEQRVTVQQVVAKSIGYNGQRLSPTAMVNSATPLIIDNHSKPDSLVVSCESITLNQGELGLDLNFNPDKLKNIDTLIINKHKYQKVKE